MKNPQPPERNRFRLLRRSTSVRIIGGIWLVFAGACGTPPANGADAELAKPSVVVCLDDGDCDSLDDGDPCNGQLACDSGACRVDPATVVTCDPSADTACAADTCEPDTGACKLLARNDGLPCDDGAPCSVGDKCAAGQCGSGALSACECTTDAACADDANKCNGVPHCDTSAFPYKCVPKPGTSVQCADDGKPCTVATCHAETGKCAPIPGNHGGNCDDGEPCTTGDVCASGECVGAATTCACVSNADCKDTDQNPCTGVPFCSKPDGAKADAAGTCKINPATVVVCSAAADNACRKNVCLSSTGKCALAAQAEGKTCDDGEACTKGEVCLGGECAGGENTCKCASDEDCEGADDGDSCNGTLACNKQTGSCDVDPATYVNCASVDDTACAKNVCLPKTGKCTLTARADTKLVACGTTTVGGKPFYVCKFRVRAAGEPADAPSFACEDGNPCTKPDACAGETCLGGAKVCECAANADCLDDGDLCNGTPVCNKLTGKCETNSATKVSCPSVDDTDCLKNTCAPNAGICLPTPVKKGGKCDDADVCTVGDSCSNGACAGGTFVCECQADTDCASKDDGDLCNGVMFCDTSGKTAKCAPNPASKVFCSKKDDTDCVQSACDTKTGKCGLAPASNGLDCDDGNACTVKTTCSAGACQGGGAAACDDKDKCTQDNCDTTIGCVHKIKTCADGNACTADACSPITGLCSNTALKLGAVCDGDGDGCTVNDRCGPQGTCVTGVPVVCLNAAGPCQEAVCQAKSAQQFACVLAAKPENTPCPDDAASCTLGAKCKAGLCQAATQPALFNKSVDPGAGGGRFRDLVLAEDGAFVGGERYLSTSKPLKNARWWVVRLGRDGSVLWQSGALSPSPGDGVAAQRVTLSKAVTGVAQTVFALGTTHNGVDRDVVMVRLTDKGKLITKTPLLAEKGADERAFGLDRNSDGYVIASVLSTAAGKTTHYRVTMTPSGEVTKAIPTQWSGGKYKEMPWTVGTPGPAAITTGLGGVHTYPHVVNGKQEGHGIVDHFNRFRTTTAGQACAALVGLSNGQFMSAWNSTDGTTASARRHTSSKFTYNPTIKIATKAKTSAIAAQPDGGFILAGQLNGDGWLASVDNLDIVTGTTTVAGPGNDSVAAVAVEASGPIVGVGATEDVQGRTTGWLLRTDPWLNTDCTTAGTCAGKHPSACDDGNACTFNACTAANGCDHPLKPSGSPCPSPTGCSKKASCAAGTCANPLNGEVHFSWDWTKYLSKKTIGFRTDGGQTLPVAYVSEFRELRSFPKSLYMGFCSPVHDPVRFRSIGELQAAVLGDSKASGTNRVGLCRWKQNVHYSDLVADNKVTLVPPGSCGTCAMYARDLGHAVDGSVVVVADIAMTKSHIAVTRLTAKNEVVYNQLAGFNNANRHAAAVAVWPSAVAQWAGWREGATWSTDVGLVYRHAPSGKITWTRVIGVKGKGVRLKAIASESDGAVIVGGQQYDYTNIWRQFVARLKSNGATDWTWAAETPDMAEITSIALVGDGSFVTVFDRVVAGIEQTFLSRQTKDVSVFQYRLVPDSPSTRFRSTPGTLLRGAKGGWWVGGLFSSQYASFGTGIGAHFRASQWGPADCVTLGDCYGKTPQDCDDGKPGTADICMPGKGCVHVPLAGG